MAIVASWHSSPLLGICPSFSSLGLKRPPYPPTQRTPVHGSLCPPTPTQHPYRLQGHKHRATPGHQCHGLVTVKKRFDDDDLAQGSDHWGQHCCDPSRPPSPLRVTHLVSFIHQGLEGCEQSPVGTHGHQHILEWVQLLSQELPKETRQDLCQWWVTLQDSRVSPPEKGNELARVTHR